MIFLHGARQSLEEEEDDDDIFFFKWMAEVGRYSIESNLKQCNAMSALQCSASAGQGTAVQGRVVFLIDLSFTNIYTGSFN